MDKFNELTSSIEPWEIARAAFFDEFNPTHIEEIIEALYSIPLEDIENEDAEEK